MRPLWLLGVVSAVGLSLAACKGKSEAPKQAAPVASVALAASFPPFTAVPPQAANTGALGVRWSVYVSGSGKAPGPADQIAAEVTVRKRDGSSGSSQPGKQSLGFSAYSLPEPLRDSVASLRAGAKARYWVPKGALTKKPSGWADDDLVLDLEVTRIDIVQQVERALSAKAPDALVPLPDVTPPTDAKTSPKGYRYVRVVAGEGGVQPRADSRVKIRFSAWRVDGLIVKPVALDQAATVELSQAPDVVTELASKMVAGDVVRAWVPGSAAKGLVAEDVKALIVDLGLASIE